MVFRSFRLHCRRASFLFVSRLGCATAFCPYKGFRGQRFGLFCACGFVAFLGCFGLGFRWCLAVTHPLPTSFIFVCVSARLRYGFLSVYCGGSVGNVSAFFVPAVS